MRLSTLSKLLLTGALGVALAPRPAAAFCGFYVAGSDQQMFNDATQVVLMREGTRTVLAMQNTYQGPPQDFALVIPVPVVLHEGDVKTLPKDVFAHVEQMGAPRLVEYWERDPCLPPEPLRRAMAMPTMAGAPDTGGAPGGMGVTIEAKFAVGEYQILILSAKDSTGLDAWLHLQNYKIPDGAEPLLRPYVESGMKFFVAKVDPAKVKFENGRAALSPLRFHYDSDDFALPIRLGLANSSGTQDLIVSIFSPHQRYEVSNYKNVTIPTNLDVTEAVKAKFGAFYAALFDRTVAKNPGAVVTEYAWQATGCDPCPGPTLRPAELQTLGADVLGGTKEHPAPIDDYYDMVLTRLHARYGKDITNDLVFKQAQPIVGGREFVQSGGQLEEGARADSVNNFQARYAIRHEWTGPITCANPTRHIWGGPPAAIAAQPGFQATGVQPAPNLALAPRDPIALPEVVVRDVPEIDLHASLGAASAPSPGSAAGSAHAGSAQAAPAPPSSPPPPAAKQGCGCATDGDADALGGALLVGATLAVGRRRRRRGAGVGA